MAVNKEHQGLQVALILFVLVTIALAVTSFIFYKEWEKQLAVAEGHRQSAADQERIHRAVDAEMVQLKEAMGYAPDKSVADIALELENFKKQYAATYPDAATDVGAMLENLTEVTHSLQRAAVSHAAQVAKLEDEKKRVQDELAAAVKAFEQDRNEQVAQLVAADKAHKAQLESLNETIAAKDKAIADAQAVWAKKEGELINERTALANQLRNLKTNLDRAVVNLKDLKDTDLASPDGQITGVSEGIVFLNIGSADGLRRQTSFAVYDRDVSQVTPDTPAKAMIEVTRLLGNHVAEARILESQLSNPVLTDDVIFSTAFTPGQVEHFALAGTMDIDGNGTDDLEQLRSIININGGVIDAIVDSEGKRSGKPTFSTRFMVVGEPPAPTESNADAIRNFSALLKEAETAGVKTISLAKFLDYVGFVGRERSVGLGRRADPSDFRTRDRGGNAGSLFQRRQP